MIIEAKILNKTLAKRIQQYLKMIIYHDQVGFIPGVLGCTISHKSIYKNHMIISMYACSITSVMSDSCNPLTVVLQAPLSMGFSRQEHWSGLPCPPPGDLPDSWIERASLALQADSLSWSHQGHP